MGVVRAAFDPRYGEAWSAGQLGGTLARPEAFARRLVADGEVRGFTLCREIGPDVELLLVAVTPEARQRGFAGRLIDAALGDASARGAMDMFLEVRANNDAALRLYRSHGFAEVGRRPDYYGGIGGERFPAITMRRTINC